MQFSCGFYYILHNLILFQTTEKILSVFGQNPSSHLLLSSESLNALPIKPPSTPVCLMLKGGPMTYRQACPFPNYCANLQRRRESAAAPLPPSRPVSYLRVASVFIRFLQGDGWAVPLEPGGWSVWQWLENLSIQSSSSRGNNQWPEWEGSKKKKWDKCLDEFV